MIHTFCYSVNKHRHAIMPLARQLFTVGFELWGRSEAGEIRISDYLDTIEKDPAGAEKMLMRFDQKRGGRIELCLGKQRLAHIEFSAGDWSYSITLDLFDNPDLDLVEIQRKWIEAYELDDLETVLDFAAGFLSGITDKNFGYRLRTSRGEFVRAGLKGSLFTLELTDIATFIRIMFFFMRKSDPSLLIRSPLDLLRLFEELQDAVRYLADAFEDHSLTLEIKVEKQVVFRCGQGVKANFGGRFGATSIQLEAWARILAAAMPGRGE